MNNDSQFHTTESKAEPEFVTLCAWTRTVRYEKEWMSVEAYLERRYGVVVSHGMSPAAMRQQEAKEASAPLSQQRSSHSTQPALRNPRRLAAVKATRLLDSDSTKSFDRLTRIGARLLGVPTTFISLVDSARDIYLSNYGFAEPLASKREITGQTFCHFTIEGESPLAIPNTRADPVYRHVPTVSSLGIAAYLGAPLVLLSGEVIGSFCAVDTVPRAWTDAQIQDAVDLASLIITEIEARQMALDTQKERRD